MTINASKNPNRRKSTIRAKKKRKYVGMFLKRGKWWVPWTDDLPGALTQGRTLEEARENLKDAIAMMLA